MLGKLLRALIAIVVIVVSGGIGYLLLAPPALLRVANGYASKIVCSNVFIAGRDANAVLAEDVQAPGNPILRFISIDVDQAAKTVTARLFGFVAPVTSIYREGLGCAAVPDGNLERAAAVAAANVPAAPAPGGELWPQGNRVEREAEAGLSEVLDNDILTGPNMRAVVVVKDGQIVGERYGAGFDAGTPQLGWSMTKTVNALLLGRVMMEGRIGFDDAALLPEWQNDVRAEIRLRDLLGMTSGLEFNEEYGDVSDVTRMLYLEPDMAEFAANKARTVPSGTLFNYSSGTGTLLSRIWMDRFVDQNDALAYPRTALFAPLGMSSAVMEADEGGTLVGSSYMYASARDWARIGQFLLQDGVWNGARLVPPGFVTMMRASNGLAGGYSQIQAWLVGPREETIGAAGLPAGTFWLRGHDGQSMAVIPSMGLVVLRLGLTPSSLGWGPEALVKATVDALR